MAIPVDIQELLDARVVESTRIEYKAGFNPAAIVRTLCAFANDMDNTGGGYILIGVEEENGRPKFPLKGVDLNDVDLILKKLLEYCHYIEPLYEPVSEPVKYFDLSDNTEKEIIVIWAPAGYGRPYKAPKNVLDPKSIKEFYIRKFSSSVVASQLEMKELFYISSSIPFDDRPCLPANVEDLSKDQIKSFLYEIGSKIYPDSDKKSLLSLAQDLRIVSGSPENIKPLNVGILMFSDRTQKYFPYARIELVFIPDPTGTNMIEKVFTGTLQNQLRGAVQYIKDNVIQEAVIKHSDKAEAERFFNYPYEAIEELLANAVYHRSYQNHEPVTVRIEKDSIEITSTPGFDRTISDEAISNYNLRSRVYRNRRIGEFLKELHLTEGRNTGFPNAFTALERNGSGKPEFLMNDERDFISVIIPIHPYFKSSAKAEKDTLYFEKVLSALEESMTLTQLAHKMGYKGISRKLKSSLEILLSKRRVESFIENGEIKYRKKRGY